MRRRPKAFLAAIALAALGMLSIVWLVGPDDVPPTTLRCADCTTIAVERVVDGDTLVSQGQRIRLYGIDAPELGDRCADGATERLRRLAGDEVRVEPGPRARDPHGRPLAYLYTTGGMSIDELLITEGHAIAWTADGQHRDHLVAMEQQARASGSGCLW